MFERIKKLVKDINTNYDSKYNCYLIRWNLISFTEWFMSDAMFLEMIWKAHKDVYAESMMVSFDDRRIEFYD